MSQSDICETFTIIWYRNKKEYRIIGLYSTSEGELNIENNFEFREVK